MKSNLGVGLERIKKRFEEARVFLKKFEKEKRESEISGQVSVAGLEERSSKRSLNSSSGKFRSLLNYCRNIEIV